MEFNNRITEITGAKYPIMQAPMGWIARAQLASAVSNAGGIGVIETSSGELDNIKLELEKMATLARGCYGMNVALAYVKGGTDIIDFVINAGVKFVTTSAGSAQIVHPAFPAGRYQGFSCGTYSGRCA